MAIKIFLLISILIFVATQNEGRSDCSKISQRIFVNSVAIEELIGQWYVVESSENLEDFVMPNLIISHSVCSLQDLLSKMDPRKFQLQGFRVLHLHSVNIAILYRCVETEISTNHESVIILSRDRTPNLFAAKIAKGMLRNFGIKAPTFKIDQSECRSERRRDHLTRSGAYRRMLEVPTDDYVIRFLLERCLAMAQVFADFQNCVDQFNARQIPRNYND